ncbi:hypothetical protein PLANPX_5493 [Lacipirellula parvula]|uniref:PEP-CTERM protein-sorting domain-containing protein n=2 Tax=Lacipirellula parvula TaxID=2650471 RepID=A0A5K7XKZ4_9BACT|nr:hypothetical protein PLANPX_5493 [Lacipirellula parvula]
MRHAIRSIQPALILSAAWLSFSAASAQTVINVPPAFAPSTIGAGTTLNLLDGGTIYNLSAESGAAVNVLGGAATSISGRAGSNITMSAGQVETLWFEGQGEVSGGGIQTHYSASGATTTISGGAMGTIGTHAAASLNILGVDFAVNGVPLSGLIAPGDSILVNLADGDQLTGILANGTPLGHYQDLRAGESVISNGTLRLTRSAAPPTPVPGVIDVSTISTLPFVSAGQTLRLQNGAQLPKRFRAGPGSTVEINGGSTDNGMYAMGASVVVDGGEIGHGFRAFDGTTVTLKSGRINDSQYLRGSTLNVQGGDFYGWLREGSTLNVTGGLVSGASIDDDVTATISGGQINQISGDKESTVNIFGGEINSAHLQGAVHLYGGRIDDDPFRVRVGGKLFIHATEFRLNGVPIAGLQNVGDSQVIPVPAGSVLSGVYSNGAPFVFSGDRGEIDAPISLIQSAPHGPLPTSYTVNNAESPDGIHDGQTLTLQTGGALPAHFTVGQGGHLVVQAGTVGRNLEVIDATFDMLGGAASTTHAYRGATVNIGGTAEFGGVTAYNGSIVNIGGAARRGTFDAKPGAIVNVSGGQLLGSFYADGAQVNISGGAFESYSNPDPSTATNGSVIKVSGGSQTGLRLYQGAKLQATGGSIDRVEAHSTTEVLVDGGAIGDLAVTPGASAVVETGIVGNSGMWNGGKIVFHGGALGDIHQWQLGEIELHGVDFQIDGVAIPGLNAVGDSVLFNYVPGTDFTALLSDGTPIAMMDEQTQGLLTGGVVRLIRSAAPTYAPLVDVSGSNAPFGAAPSQTVRVHAGGKLGPNFTAGPGSIVEIQAGTVGDNFEADRSDVLISGGVVGEKMDVFKDAVVDVAGGSVGRYWEVHPHGELQLSGGLLGPQGTLRGGTLNVSGGSVSGDVDALDQSVVNVSSGEIGNGLELLGGSQANVTGGLIGANFRVGASSTAHISGGQVRELELQSTGRGEFTGGVVDLMQAESGSTANIRGGAFGDGFDVSTGAQASLFGANFEINGVAVPGLAQPGDQVTLTVAANEIFTGTLSDGTPFAFDSRESDRPRTVTLKWTQPAAAASVVEVDSALAPLGVRAGQQLNLRAGGKLADSFNVGRGAEFNIHGGVVGKNLEAFAATVNIHGGQVGADFDAFAGTTVNVDGGSIGANFDVYSGAQLNFRGGYAFDVDALGAAIAVEGGKIRDLSLSGANQVNWRGGVVDAFSFFSTTGSSLGVFGGDFKLNGNPIGGLANVGDSVAFNPTQSDVLTGVLADGTPLVFRSLQSGVPTGLIRLKRAAVPTPNLPAFQQVVDANAPFAIGAGQTLQLAGAGVLKQGFIAGPGSELRIDGGLVETDMKAFDADIRVTGGVVKGNVQFFGNVDANILGGTFEGTAPLMMAGSDVTLFGTQFFLNNVPISGLNAPGSSLILSQRAGQMLKAILADGSTLQWRLQPFTAGGRGGPTTGIAAGATLRIQMIPEPAAIQMLAASLALSACYARRRWSR